MKAKERKIETLNKKSISSIKLNGKRQRFYDGDYLYLVVSKNGAKSFYFRGYTFNGKKVSDFSIGTYRINDKDNSGDLTLSEAREKAREIVRTYRKGIDYRQQQRQEKEKARFDQSNTLNDWFNRWIETKADKAESTQRDYSGRYAKWMAPAIGSRPIDQISINEIEKLYNKIQKECSPEMGKRCNIILNGIFTLANKKLITSNNPSLLAKEVIKPTADSHYPALTKDDEVAQLLIDMDNYKGYLSTIYALRLAPYLILRPANLVALKWADINENKRLIYIDAKDMKTKKPHCVPYPQQAADILSKLQAITGHGTFIFPNHRSTNHIHRDTLSKGLRAMGYQGKHTPHGFRAMATSWLYDNQYYSYHIEMQLAHVEPNKVVRAYSRGDEMRYIDDRRKMLQDWADHLEKIKSETNNKLSI